MRLILAILLLRQSVVTKSFNDFILLLATRKLLQNLESRINVLLISAPLDRYYQKEPEGHPALNTAERERPIIHILIFCGVLPLQW